VEFHQGQGNETKSLLNFNGRWIFQVKSLDNIPADVERMIIGVAREGNVRKKLEIPK